MATYALIHGPGDVGWYWHLVAADLRARGHDVVAPDLPCEDPSAGLADYELKFKRHVVSVEPVVERLSV